MQRISIVENRSAPVNRPQNSDDTDKSSEMVLEILRSDLSELETHGQPVITDVHHVSSYSWIDRKPPTIAVPGSPPLWSPPASATRVHPDSGKGFINENEARHPRYPYEPIFRALFMTHPQFDMSTIDVFTNRHCLRRLLSFVDARLEKPQDKPVLLTIETVGNMVILRRRGLKAKRFIAPGQFQGYGHNFERAFTTSDGGSTTHQRLIRYQFCGLNLLVLHETDGYVAADIPEQNKKTDDLLEAVKGLTISNSPQAVSDLSIPGSKLQFRAQGQLVDRELTLEMKTKAKNEKRLEVSFSKFAAQMWISQTPKLVRAYHKAGVFEVPAVKDMSDELKAWEDTNKESLLAFGALLGKLVSLAKEHGRIAVHWTKGAPLLVAETDPGKRYSDNLPPDLYERILKKPTEG